jgi:hypothetical protein
MQVQEVSPAAIWPHGDLSGRFGTALPHVTGLCTILQLALP